MALPPEKISIKRRRGDEPVETLVLERDSKRRFTDFFFQRLRNEQIDLAPAKQQSGSNEYDTNSRQGIPNVKITMPGDESEDIANYRAAQKAQSGGQNTIQSNRVSDSIKDASASRLSNEVAPNNRRFHLTRDLSSALKPRSNHGLRKFQSSIRPPLPTFVEHRYVFDKQEITSENPTSSDRLPDADIPKQSKAHVVRDAILDDRSSGRTEVQTFVSPKTHRVKLGRSIRDDPATWDQDSDQLADELAALAMEMDPTVEAKYAKHTEQQQRELELPMDDYVYETYVRMPVDDSHGVSDPKTSTFEVGFLVIDEEVNDLWEQYVRDEDDEDEWDEEDEDSNAEENPRNDYPDDEVSSDDEYGRNVYKYRANASSDEEYGDD